AGQGLGLYGAPTGGRGHIKAITCRADGGIEGCEGGGGVEMKLPHPRQFLHLAAGAAVLSGVSRLAWGRTSPARPVHWIVSFAAGGANDIVARIVGQYLSDHLGQQFIVENRSGAGGNVGMQSVLSSVPDGYTIAFVGPNYAINPTLYEKLPFNFIRD